MLTEHPLHIEPLTLHQTRELGAIGAREHRFERIRYHDIARIEQPSRRQPHEHHRGRVLPARWAKLEALIACTERERP